MVFHCCALASTSCRSRRGCQVGHGICALKTQLFPVQICAVLCTHITEHAWCTFHPGSSLCLNACSCRAVCSLPQTRIVLGPCLHACVLPASCRSLLQCLFWSSASVLLPACAPAKMAVPRHGGVTAFPSRAPQPCHTADPHSRASAPSASVSLWPEGVRLRSPSLRVKEPTCVCGACLGFLGNFNLY